MHEIKMCIKNNSKDSPLFTKDTNLVYISAFLSLIHGLYIGKCLVSLVTLVSTYISYS